MASCVRNISTKNYQNLIIAFQVIVENVMEAFLGHSVYSKVVKACFREYILKCHIQSINESLAVCTQCFKLIFVLLT